MLFNTPSKSPHAEKDRTMNQRLTEARLALRPRECANYIPIEATKEETEVIYQQEHTFYPFRNLPYELRLQIWNVSIFQPRVLELRRVVPKSCKKLTSPRLASMCGPPVSLSICKETRELAEGKYILCDRVVKLFLNPEVDTLFFGNYAGFSVVPDLIRHASRDEIAQVKKLAVENDRFRILATEMGDGARSSIIYRFAALSELIIVFANPCPCELTATFLGLGKDCMECGLCAERRRCVMGLNGWTFPTFRQFAEKRGESTEVPEGEADRMGMGYRAVLGRRIDRPCRWTGLWEWVWKDVHGIDCVDSLQFIRWYFERRGNGGMGTAHDVMVRAEEVLRL